MKLIKLRSAQRNEICNRQDYEKKMIIAKHAGKMQVAFYVSVTCDSESQKVIL